MNRQESRYRVRSRYHRCPGVVRKRPAPSRAARIAGLAADMLPGALMVFTGGALIAVGIDFRVLTLL